MADPKDQRDKPLSFWAAELGCHIDTLRRAVQNKELLAYHHPTARGRPLMARAEDVAAFAASKRSSAPVTPNPLQKTFEFQ